MASRSLFLAAASLLLLLSSLPATTAQGLNSDTLGFVGRDGEDLIIKAPSNGNVLVQTAGSNSTVIVNGVDVLARLRQLERLARVSTKSQGFCAPGFKRIAEVWLDGVSVYNVSESRGLHVVVFNEDTTAVESTGVFDFHGASSSSGATVSQALVDFLNGVQQSRVVVAVVADTIVHPSDSNRKPQQLAIAAFESAFGSESAMASIAFREAWVLVGRVGETVLTQVRGGADTLSCTLDSRATGTVTTVIERGI